jgi:hypothetical protein
VYVCVCVRVCVYFCVCVDVCVCVCVLVFACTCQNAGISARDGGIELVDFSHHICFLKTCLLFESH